MGMYARERVAHLWVVDPTPRTLEVYRRDGERWIAAGTHQGARRVRVAPFEGIELDLRRWWGEA
jgi:hypothetical protein